MQQAWYGNSAKTGKGGNGRLCPTFPVCAGYRRHCWKHISKIIIYKNGDKTEIRTRQWKGREGRGNRAGGMGENERKKSNFLHFIYQPTSEELTRTPAASAQALAQWPLTS